jgi:hypothetical protein
MAKRRRRNNGALIAWVSVGVVVAIVATFVLVKELNSGGSERTAFGQTSQAVFNDVTQIPASVYNQVGVSSPTIQVQPVAVLYKQPAYTSHGLPGAFYFGAEFCPYCAATRWGIIAALSRFGTFDKLYNMWSSATDPAGPNTPTFTFYGVHYHSTHFHFVGYEVEDRNGKALMSMPAEVNNLVLKYNPQETFPFMDMANKVFIRTSAFDPLALSGYHTQASIATHLDDPSNYITQAIVTTANYVSAGLCSISKDPPQSVCTSSGVKAAAHALGLKLPS